MTKRQWYSFVGTVITVIIVVGNSFLSSRTGSVSKEVLPEPQKEVSATSTVTAPLIIADTNSASTSEGPTNALVVHVMDGDTVEALVDGQQKPIKVRLLGVNTPESVDPRRPVQCFGKEASNFTKQTLDGKRILLKEDVQADDLDKYGRSLRNIFLADGTDFNALLVKQGYAYEYTSFPQNKQRKAELKHLQLEAQIAKRGLWDPNTCDGMK